MQARTYTPRAFVDIRAGILAKMMVVIWLSNSNSYVFVNVKSKTRQRFDVIFTSIPRGQDPAATTPTVGTRGARRLRVRIWVLIILEFLGYFLCPS
jgi:hypothetical protein